MGDSAFLVAASSNAAARVVDCGPEWMSAPSDSGWYILAMYTAGFGWTFTPKRVLGVDGKMVRVLSWGVEYQEPIGDSNNKWLRLRLKHLEDDPC